MADDVLRFAQFCVLAPAFLALAVALVLLHSRSTPARKPAAPTHAGTLELVLECDASRALHGIESAVAAVQHLHTMVDGLNEKLPGKLTLKSVVGKPQAQRARRR